MRNEIKLREATMDDADLLLEWRNDPSTRKQFRNPGEVKREEHILWLTDIFKSQTRKLYIPESDGIPIGTVRADYKDKVCELSWTIAPDARGKGLGKKMVLVLAQSIKGPIRAEIKSGNKPSIGIAEHIGMKFEREENGFLHYSRIFS